MTALFVIYAPIKDLSFSIPNKAEETCNCMSPWAHNFAPGAAIKNCKSDTPFARLTTPIVPIGRVTGYRKIPFVLSDPSPILNGLKLSMIDMIEDSFL